MPADELPDELQSALKFLLGMEWPEGDTDGLNRISSAWSELSGALEAMEAALERSSRGVQDNMGGEFAEAYRGFSVAMRETMGEIRKNADGLADVSKNTAADIMYAKVMIIGQLVIMLAMMALEWIPFIGPALAAAAQVIARVVISQILAKVIANILLGAAMGLVLELGLDVAIQGVQMLTGQRTDWNEDFTTGAAISGVVSGAVGGAAGSLLHMGVGALGRGAGKDAGKALDEIAPPPPKTESGGPGLSEKGGAFGKQDGPLDDVAPPVKEGAGKQDGPVDDVAPPVKEDGPGAVKEDGPGSGKSDETGPNTRDEDWQAKSWSDRNGKQKWLSAGNFIAQGPIEGAAEVIGEAVATAASGQRIQEGGLPAFTSGTAQSYLENSMGKGGRSLASRFGSGDYADLTNINLDSMGKFEEYDPGKPDTTSNRPDTSEPTTSIERASVSDSPGGKGSTSDAVGGNDSGADFTGRQEQHSGTSGKQDSVSDTSGRQGSAPPPYEQATSGGHDAVSEGRYAGAERFYGRESEPPSYVELAGDGREASEADAFGRSGDRGRSSGGDSQSIPQLPSYAAEASGSQQLTQDTPSGTNPPGDSDVPHAASRPPSYEEATGETASSSGAGSDGQGRRNFGSSDGFIGHQQTGDSPNEAPGTAARDDRDEVANPGASQQDPASSQFVNVRGTADGHASAAATSGPEPGAQQRSGTQHNTGQPATTPAEGARPVAGGQLNTPAALISTSGGNDATPSGRTGPSTRTVGDTGSTGNDADNPTWGVNSVRTATPVPESPRENSSLFADDQSRQRGSAAPDTGFDADSALDPGLPRDQESDHEYLRTTSQPPLGHVPDSSKWDRARVEAARAEGALGKVSEARVIDLRLRAGAIVVRENQVPESTANRELYEHLDWIVAHELHAHGWAADADERTRVSAETAAHALAVSKAHEYRTRRTTIPPSGFGSGPHDAPAPNSGTHSHAGPSRTGTNTDPVTDPRHGNLAPATASAERDYHAAIAENIDEQHTTNTPRNKTRAPTKADLAREFLAANPGGAIDGFEEYLKSNGYSVDKAKKNSIGVTFRRALREHGQASSSAAKLSDVDRSALARDFLAVNPEGTPVDFKKSLRDKGYKVTGVTNASLGYSLEIVRRNDSEHGVESISDAIEKPVVNRAKLAREFIAVDPDGDSESFREYLGNQGYNTNGLSDVALKSSLSYIRHRRADVSGETTSGAAGDPIVNRAELARGFLGLDPDGDHDDFKTYLESEGYDVVGLDKKTLKYSLYYARINPLGVAGKPDPDATGEPIVNRAELTRKFLEIHPDGDPDGFRSYLENEGYDAAYLSNSRLVRSLYNYRPKSSARGDESTLNPVQGVAPVVDPAAEHDRRNQADLGGRRRATGDGVNLTALARQFLVENPKGTTKIFKTYLNGKGYDVDGHTGRRISNTLFDARKEKFGGRLKNETGAALARRFLADNPQGESDGFRKYLTDEGHDFGRVNKGKLGETLRYVRNRKKVIDGGSAAESTQGVHANTGAGSSAGGQGGVQDDLMADVHQEGLPLDTDPVTGHDLDAIFADLDPHDGLDFNTPDQRPEQLRTTAQPADHHRSAGPYGEERGAQQDHPMTDANQESSVSDTAPAAEHDLDAVVAPFGTLDGFDFGALDQYPEPFDTHPGVDQNPSMDDAHLWFPVSDVDPMTESEYAALFAGNPLDHNLAYPPAATRPSDEHRNAGTSGSQLGEDRDPLVADAYPWDSAVDNVPMSEDGFGEAMFASFDPGNVFDFSVLDQDFDHPPAPPGSGQADQPHGDHQPVPERTPEVSDAGMASPSLLANFLDPETSHVQQN